jgi:hypothetical protein
MVACASQLLEALYVLPQNMARWDVGFVDVAFSFLMNKRKHVLHLASLSQPIRA